MKIFNLHNNSKKIKSFKFEISDILVYRKNYVYVIDARKKISENEYKYDLTKIYPIDNNNYKKILNQNFKNGIEFILRGETDKEIHYINYNFILPF